MPQRSETVNESKTFRPRYWLAVGLAIPLGVWAATVGIMSIPPSQGSVNLADGHETFKTHCAACHFAKGGFPAHHGPNLHDIGRVGASRRPNLTAAEYILESILDPDAFVSPSSRPGMPNNVAAELSPEAIRNVVAFLASCGAFPDYDKIASLEIPDRRSDQTEKISVRLKDMDRAVHILQEKGSCLQCHSLHNHPEYQVFAPGLFGVGLTDKTLLKQSIVDPNKIVLPHFRSVNVILQSGDRVSGRLISRNESRLVLFTRDKESRVERREIPLSEVETEDGQPLILESKVSLMPTGFDKILTHEEIEAIITLIRQLN